MATTQNYLNLPFNEAIDFFRQKVNLPTEKWTDIWQGQHSRAFVVAGAARGDLLSDLRSAVDKAIAQGTTLNEFKRDFGKIIEKTGWQYKGGHDWRTRVIYETNLRTANAAGRYKQMTDPDVLKSNPYWMYRHGGSAQPRADHLSWDGLVLPADDPWWRTHYPPNGWGCSCYVDALSEDDLTRLGVKVSTPPNDGTYEWTNPSTGETIQVPNGIQPGWAYNVGQTTGQVKDNKGPWSLMAQGKKTPVPGPLTPVKSTIKPNYKIPDTPAGIASYLTQSFGGQQTKTFTFNKGGFRVDLAVDAKYLGDHLTERDKHGKPKIGRAAFLPYLEDLIENPQEVWLAFEQSATTGKIRLRQRFLKYLDTGAKDSGLVMIFNATGGQMESVTFIPRTTPNYLDNQRKGFLAYKK